ARDDLLDVVPHRTDRARDHADAPRRRGERPLAFDGKESLGGEAPLERFEPEVRVARASRPDVVDLKLAPPVLCVELDVAVCEHLAAVAWRERDLRGLHGEEHASQLARLARVLDRSA